MASISAMSACACLPSRICPWDPKFRLNFFHLDARNGFGFGLLFAIALCICTESSFRWTQISVQIVGQMWIRLRTARLYAPKLCFRRIAVSWRNLTFAIDILGP